MFHLTHKAMKDNQNKKATDGKDLIKDINSVPKEVTNNKDNQNVDDPKRPAQGGRYEGTSVQDGGQDVGSSAGSH